MFAGRPAPPQVLPLRWAELIAEKPEARAEGIRFVDRWGGFPQLALRASKQSEMDVVRGSFPQLVLRALKQSGFLLFVANAYHQKRRPRFSAEPRAAETMLRE